MLLYSSSNKTDIVIETEENLLYMVGKLFRQTTNRNIGMQ